MPVAVISDIHGNLAALQAVLADIRRRGINRVVCLGDIAFKGPQPAECLAAVRSVSDTALSGNTEIWLLQGPTPGAPPFVDAVRAWTLPHLDVGDLQYLQSLPEQAVLAVGPTEVLLVHGSPRSPHEFIWPWTPDAELQEMLQGVPQSVVCFGHCHHAFSRRAHSRLLIGVGSVGMPFDGDTRAAYAILHSDAGGFSHSTVRVAYDPEPTLAAARAGELADLDRYVQVLRRGTAD